MHKAVCSDCGKGCEVPFRPSGDKPIYCSDCFERKGGGSPNRSSRPRPNRPDFNKRDDTHKQLIEQVSLLNTKLDRILDALETKTKKKPITKKAEVKKVVKKSKPKAKKSKAKKASKKKAK